MRSTVKRLVMWLYCRGFMPAGPVAWLFRLLRLSEQ